MNKINYWMIFQWYFIIVKPSPAPHVTIVTQKMTSGRDYNITCILSGENLNSGIAWIGPSTYQEKTSSVSKYVPTYYEEFNCKMLNNENCTSKWTSTNWNIQNSYLTNLDVVTDDRWEEFGVISTMYNQPRHIVTFAGDHKNKLTIHFSIRAESQVDIFLCNDKDSKFSNCYWIILKTELVVIRKCQKKYQIDYFWIKEQTCLKYKQEETIQRSEILSINSWKHFTIAINKNNVVLRTNNITLLNYTDNESKYYIDVRNLVVKSSGSVPAYWKFHDYQFGWTTNIAKEQLGPKIKIQDNKFCISLYIAMCLKCTLIISALHSTNSEAVLMKNVTALKEFQWQNVKWNIASLPTAMSEVWLYIETQCIDNNYCDGQFWALDDFRLCTENEVRVFNVQRSNLKSSVLQIVDGAFKNLKMENLVSPTSGLQLPGPKCPIDSIGSTTCTRCRDIFSFSKSFCEASVICDFSINEEGICRCSPGYLGISCHQPCSVGYYGQDCTEKCGSCESTSCNTITGDCPDNKCSNNFLGKQCNIPPYPVLRNTPIVANCGDTHITIKVTNFSYDGLSTPEKYKIIYHKVTDSRNIWNETTLYDVYSTVEIPLNNLQSDTSYEIRAVLLTSEKKFYNGEDIPKIVANTTCADIEEEDIPKIFTVRNTSAFATFRDNPKLCSLEYYKISCYNHNKYIQVYPIGNEFEIQGLLPYTEYKLNITNRRQREINYKFTTKEGVPSPVLSIKLDSSSATSLTISWEKPNQPNGEIRHYEIKYKHYKYLACDSNIDNNENTVTLQQQLTTMILNNLIPFSEYTISIAAVTEVKGAFSRIRQSTTETDNPDQSEIPTGINVEPSSETAELTFEQAKCEFVQGRIEYFISAHCTNDWCLNAKITLNTSYPLAQNKLTLTGLLPYSKYIMNVIFGRPNGNVYMEKQLTSTFETQPSEPNFVTFDIYEKSNKMIRLRITPPDPPRGILEYYHIEVYYYYNNGQPTIVKDLEPSYCKIWTKYHCLDISDLKKDTSYIISVQAKNTNVSKLGVAGHYINAVTVQELSTAPEKLSYSWDNYYNLTLQWNHPNFTNGPLTKFSIVIYTENIECYIMYDYMVTDKNIKLTYNYVVAMQEKNCYTSKITVIVQCFNAMPGGSTYLNIYSPPETPSLNNDPFVESVSNTTITIVLSAKKFLLSKSFIYIVISESKSKFAISDVEDLYKLDNLKSLGPSWLIAKYNLNTELPMEKLTIGSNESNSLSNNNDSNTAIILSQNTSYTITIIMYSEYQNQTRYRVYEIVNRTTGISITSNNNSSSGALFSLLLLLLLPLLIWIYIRKRKTGKWCLTNLPNIPRVQRNPDVVPLQKLTSEIVVPKPEIPSEHIIYNNVNVSKDDNKMIGSEFSKPIKLNDFSRYVKNAIATGELARQHSIFPRGQIKPCDYGNLPQNKSKNRYNNLIAYDHTRVKLKKINNDLYSDYINANYINGYKSKKAYIATQGPKLSTINDFWRMIWQENVKFIVMLANVLEGGKKKTEQYWPNMNQTSQFGNISVTYVSTEVFADYEHRTFLATSNNTEREIEQLHFISWPDHGIPMYSQSLVPLFKKLLSIPQETSPIVVHCSAGVGRTGTVILCDLCLRTSLREGVVDVLKYQHKIREQRANLVDNLEQYKLVHLVLLDCLLNPDTSITCNEETEKNILHILETDKLEKQFQHISNIAWQDQAMRPVIEIKQKPEWKQKNRFEDIIPSGYGHIFLSHFPATDEQSDYINAVEVDGFKARKRFIATQQPMPNTTSDFWRMIDENDVSIIVSLNDIDERDNKSCVFWPTSKINEMQPVPYLLIKFSNEICNDEIITVNLELHNNKHKDHTKRDIKLIKLKGWLSDELIPNSDVSLLKLFNEVEKVSQNKNPIVVTCYDGATACGLFIAFTFLIEKIKLEHQCDVCLAVRTVRHNRDQFVQNLEQLKYLYRAAIAYLSTFKLYSNFL